MRISDWSSDVCSSDLGHRLLADVRHLRRGHRLWPRQARPAATTVFYREGVDLVAVGRPGADGGAARRLGRPALRPHAGAQSAELGWPPGDAEAVDGDRTSGGSGKSVSIRIDSGGRGPFKKKKSSRQNKQI